MWIFGKYENLFSHSGIDLLLLVASGIVALTLGDTVFIRSLSFIYVSQAFPVGQCTFLILTVVTAILFLSEAFPLLNIVGGGLILGGLCLVVGFGHPSTIPALKSVDLKGLLLAFSAAAALTLFQYDSHARINLSFIKNTELTKTSLIVLSGILGYGMSGIAYVAAMQRVGAGRTVLLTLLTPVFVLILSVLFLKEKPTPLSLIGTMICVIGVMFLSV